MQNAMLGVHYGLGRPGSPHPIRAMCGSSCSVRFVAHDRGGRTMAIGPVQLIVLGFEHPEFHGEIIAELERLKQSDTAAALILIEHHWAVPLRDAVARAGGFR